jgi:hypothetical protein
MQHRVTGFVNLHAALKELEPYVRNGEHLLTGRDFPSLSVRSREILANWLICVAVNSTHQCDRLALMGTTAPIGGDGIILDTQTGETWVTEHVADIQRNGGTDSSAAERILSAIDKKREKGGAAYAQGKTLVIFLLTGGGEWFPTKLAKKLPEPLLFDAAWVVSFESLVAEKYTYSVTRLDITQGHAPAWRVIINETFDAWRVEVIQ